MLQPELDFKSTGPELSYSRVSSSPPYQVHVVRASAPLQKAAVPTLGNVLPEACEPAITSSWDAMNGTKGN